MPAESAEPGRGARGAGCSKELSLSPAPKGPRPHALSADPHARPPAASGKNVGEFARRKARHNALAKPIFLFLARVVSGPAVDGI
ncbi:hypothetical protein PABG_12569 [Paracoccidioides brasiliensis Pb03]|nr:hypothetical protein PABG_12569 [Paracoccidioides brasiliensis Pb03]